MAKYKVEAENGVYNSRLEEKYYPYGDVSFLSDWTEDEIKYAVAAGLFSIVESEKPKSRGKINKKQDSGDEES